MTRLIENIPFTTDAGFGSKARIGLVVLASDYTIEREFRQVFQSPDVDFYTARIANSPTVTPQTLAAMEGGIAGAVELLLAGDELDVVAYCCTSATVVLGEETVFGKIRSVQPNAICTSPVTAAFAAFDAFSAKNIAVLTPYRSDVNQQLINYFTSAGYSIPVFGSFNEPQDPIVASIDKASLIRAAEQMLAEQTVDMLFVSCTSIRLLDAVYELEQKFGIPVTSSNHAMAWHCMRLAGVSDQCDVTENSEVSRLTGPQTQPGSLFSI